jgi:hypothetical protein
LRQLCDHLPAISLKNSGMQRRKNDGIYSISKKRLANLSTDSIGRFARIQRK